MKRIIYFISCLLYIMLIASQSALAANITKLKYYIDDDTANITTHLLTPNASIDSLITLTLVGISQGFHKLSVFVEDSDNKRSLTQEISFYYIHANSSQNEITKVEFIIDTLAPQTINIAPTSQLDELFTLNTTGIAPGMHILKVIVYGDDGTPSLTNYTTFFMHQGTGISNEISAFEVMIDNDTLNKQTISVSPSASFDNDISVNLSNVPQGNHQIKVTAIAQNGLRSLDNYGSFMKVNGTTTDSIVALEYFFDTEPGIGNGTRINTARAHQIDSSISIMVPNNLSLGMHRLYVRTQSNAGEWSLCQWDSLKICNIFPPTAGFNVARVGNTFSFLDTSNFATSWKWIFGDGNTDTIQHPIHSFTPNNYIVKQNVKNTCSEDSIYSIIQVKGIESYFPQQSGLGNIYIDFNGGGFDSSTIITIENNSQVYSPVKYFLSPFGNQISTHFDFHNATPGVYNIKIILEDTTIFLANGFKILTQDETSRTLKIDLLGSTFVRATALNNNIIRITNLGNANAGVTGIGLIIEDTTVEVFLKDSFIVFNASDSGYTVHIDSIGVEELRKSKGNTIDGRIYTIYIAGVRAGGVYDIPIQIKYQNPGEKNLKIICKGPYNGSDFFGWFDDCDKARMQLVWDLTTDILGTVPVVNCAWAIAQASLGIFANLAAVPLKGSSYSGGDAVQTVYDMANTMLVKTPEIAIQCSGEAGATLSAGATLVPEIIYGISKTIVDLYSNYQNMKEKCLDEEDDEDEKKIRVGTSSDPNEIVGNNGYNTDRYINDKELMHYEVYFENVDTADLPAQIVTIYDTIDMNVLDIKSFQFRGFGVGNTFYPASVDRKQYFEEFYHNGIRTRLNVNADTLTGIIAFNFVSLTAAGFDLDDPLSGFLPPNNINNDGQGWVSYSIKQKSNLPHLTKIHNSASIIFDTNEPIHTNKWTNTIDLQKPNSLVLSAHSIDDSLIVLKINRNDAHSGVKLYELGISINNRPYFTVPIRIDSDSIILTGKMDSTYSFYSIALDNADNIEQKTPLAEASITLLPTSIKKNLLQHGIQIFPNPTNGIIQVSFNKPLVGNLNYTITAIDGRIIQQRSLRQNANFSIDLNNENKGMYFIQFKQDENILGTTKIIVQ